MASRETFVIDTKGDVMFAYTAMVRWKKYADDARAFIKARAKG